MGVFIVNFLNRRAPLLAHERASPAGACSQAWRVTKPSAAMRGKPANGGIDSGSFISGLVRKRTPIQ
jgi:hypothetical protein